MSEEKNQKWWGDHKTVCGTLLLAMVLLGACDEGGMEMEMAGTGTVLGRFSTSRLIVDSFFPTDSLLICRDMPEFIVQGVTKANFIFT